MLLRAYRISDKIGLVLLKLSIALSRYLLTGVVMIVARSAALLGGLLGIILAVLRAIWRLLRSVFGAIVTVLTLIVGTGLRLAQGGAQAGQRLTSDAAGSAMARRAARVELESNLTEDPLIRRNRVLSILALLLLLALIAVVLLATNPSQDEIRPLAVANVDSSDATSPATVPAAQLPSPVPTATPLPSILEARGSLAYTVRENNQQDIWAINIGDRTPIRLTNSPEDERDAVWSPVDQKLAYASRQDGNWEIYVYDLRSETTTRMTFDLSYQGKPRWSPDGQWLVYESYQGNNLDVYIMRVDGSQVERLTDNPAPDYAPTWSPDGRRIAFVSWRDGNQDIHVFSLDDPRDAASVNVTNTPTRWEDHPVWSPDGDLLAYSALDEGVEKVFVIPTEESDPVAQVMGRGRMPTWSPDGQSLIAAVDSFDSTQLIAIPFTEAGFATAVIPVPLGSTAPNWSGLPLPAALVNSGGLPPAVVEPLYVEQVQESGGDPPYDLNLLIDVEAPVAALSDRVNDSFNALREAVNNATGVDFLGQLEDAFWPIDRLPQPGEPRRNWHMTGRAFSINRNAIAGFPAPIEIVREDVGVETQWRVYVRVADNAQNGQLGEPLRQMPWDFLSRNQGDVEAYNQGGRLRNQVPTGYYVDLTELARSYGWRRVAAGSDWRANFNGVNYWMFTKTEGLSWFDAMRELYTLGEMGGFAPTDTPAAPAPDATEAEATTPPTATSLPPTPSDALPPPPATVTEDSA